MFRSLNSGWVPQLPGLFASVADETSAAVVANAVFAGMRFFDAAPSYGHTREEIRPGRGLDLYACLRVRILTNLGITMSTLCPEQPGLYVDAEPFTPPELTSDFQRCAPHRSEVCSCWETCTFQFSLCMNLGTTRSRRRRRTSRHSWNCEIRILGGSVGGRHQLHGDGTPAHRVDQVSIMLLAGHCTILDQEAQSQVLPAVPKRNA